jgi:hypothetical protein
MTARPSPIWTHDLPAAGAALLLLICGFAVHASITRPVLGTFEAQGLSLRYPTGWYPHQEGQGHWGYQSNEDPTERIEVRIGPRPLPSVSPATAVEFERASQAGGFYKRLERGKIDLAGREWIRTRFAYAFKLDEEDAPALAMGVEYALVHGDILYVVAVHGPERRLAELEATFLRTVRVKPGPPEKP